MFYTEHHKDSSAQILIAGKSFVPFAYANLEVDAHYASYANLTWNDGNVGQDKEDEEANFLITRNEYAGPDKTVIDTVLVMDWTPDTTKRFTAADLVPGNKYGFNLYRRGVDGSQVYQEGSETKITAKTSEVTSGDTSSTALVFYWTSLYEGAAYRYTVTPEAGVKSATNLRNAARDLTPDTVYTFQLMVLE